VPTESWLRGDLKDFVHDTLLASDAACRGYMDSQVIEKIVSEHEKGAENRRQEIWTLLVFEIWHRLFMDRRAGQLTVGAVYDRARPYAARGREIQGRTPNYGDAP
jgi:hypothetical protein